MEEKFLKAQSVVELQSQEIDLLTQDRIDAKEKLRVLSVELARYQGEVFARDWRITELEQELALVRSTAVKSGPEVKNGGDALKEAERKIAAQQDELDGLKKALAQEHEARVQAAAKSGTQAGV